MWAAHRYTMKEGREEKKEKTIVSPIRGESNCKGVSSEGIGGKGWHKEKKGSLNILEEKG